MLQMEPMNRLLDTKWKKFAGPMFLINFLTYLVYLGIFTAVSYHKQSGNVSWLLSLCDSSLLQSMTEVCTNSRFFSDPQSPYKLEDTLEGYLYLSGQLLTALANCYFLIMAVCLFPNQNVI